MTENIDSLITNLYEVRQQKSVLEKTEKTLLAELKPLVDPTFELDSALIRAGNLVLTRIIGASRTIQGDLLLERGVAPDVIAFATKVSPYYQYRIKEARQ